jgi:hypothetical protein
MTKKNKTISLENSESSLPASKSQSNSESDSPNEIIKRKTFSNERFHINFAQSSEISSSQYLQKYWQISGVHFKIDSSHKFTTLSGSYNRSVPFQLCRCLYNPRNSTFIPESNCKFSLSLSTLLSTFEICTSTSTLRTE